MRGGKKLIHKIRGNCLRRKFSEALRRAFRGSREMDMPEKLPETEAKKEAEENQPSAKGASAGS